MRTCMCGSVRDVKVFSWSGYAAGPHRVPAGGVKWPEQFSRSVGLRIAGGVGLRGLEGPRVLTGSECTCGAGLKCRRCNGG